MTAVLNVTYNGLSHDLESTVPHDLGDEDIRRIAAEDRGVPPETFVNFVVDRFDTPAGGKRLFLRPKVPFGSDPVVDNVIDAKRAELNEKVRDDAIKALAAVTTLQGLIIELLGNPRYSPLLSAWRTELDDALHNLSSTTAALKLLDAVQG